MNGMTILEKIMDYKRGEVAQRKEQTSSRMLEQMPQFHRTPLSLVQSIQNGAGIIAEFKRHSPSKGDIRPGATVEDITVQYQMAGASGLSVLTDTQFFKGTSEDLQVARKRNALPILRKDFILDEYQLLEAKAIGADVVLLIAECLSEREVAQLAAFAKSLHLEVLMEIHSKDQLGKVTADIDLIGVNNRNLKTFEVNFENSIQILPDLPKGLTKVAESGINDLENILTLQRAGFDAFLIGEHFMRQERPGEECARFTKAILDQKLVQK